MKLHLWAQGSLDGIAKFWADERERGSGLNEYLDI